MLNFIRKFYALSLLLPILWVLAGNFAGCAAGPQEPDGLGPTVTTTIFGQVVDEAGTPVSGVVVTAHSSTATTDGKGLFVLKNAIVPESRLVVTAKKAGYFTAARAETPKAGGSTRTKVFMMSNIATYSVSSSSGGTVAVAGGASVQFQGSSFQTSSGSPYNGTVNVAARYLDPANINFGDFFAGDNLARTNDGSDVGLISCGVLRVELSGQSGEPLKLDASKPATISYPKPTSNATAPTSMPLWYYDETFGMWKEEGSASLQGGKYVGTVTHFTDWNLDYSGPFGTFEMRVVCNGVPVEGVAIKVAGFDHKTGYTDANGKATFIRVPADKEIQIFIRPEDNGGKYYINSPVTKQIVVGQVTDIGDITLSSPCPAIISGNLIGCGDAPTEGLISISNGSYVAYTYTTTGAFVLGVASGVPLTVTATDVNGNVSPQQDVLPLSENELRAIGDIKVCGTSTSSFIDITLTSEANSIAFSPDGSLLGVITNQGGEFAVYESETGNIKTQITLATNRYNTKIQFSTDNKKIMLAGYYSDAEIYDYSSGTMVLQATIPKALSARMYDDGSKVIVTLYDGNKSSFALYSALDGSLIKALSPTEIGDSSSSFGFIPEEEAIIYYTTQTPSNYRVWSIANDQEIRSFTVPGDYWSAQYSDDGKVIATSTDYKTFTFYDVKTQAKLGEVSIGNSSGMKYANLVFTKEFGYLPFADQTFSLVKIARFSDGTIKEKLMPSGTYAYYLAVSRGDEHLAAIYGKMIRRWKLN
jgi:WD40 repeat protein